MLRTTGTARGPLLERVALEGLDRADRVANRLYSDRFNPLYQSGTIVVFLYVVLAVTGLWLVLFYRVGAPWESVAAITADRWIGNWVRGVHRYASDLAVVFTALHAWRMFAQGRSRGARAHAWVSGLTPERPASIASQVEATSPPSGEVAPRPVTTTSVPVIVCPKWMKRNPVGWWIRVSLGR